MPRPKKSPRVRVQIIFEREQAKRLRTYCKKFDLEISQTVRWAVDRHLLESKQISDAIADVRPGPVVPYVGNALTIQPGDRVK